MCSTWVATSAVVKLLFASRPSTRLSCRRNQAVIRTGGIGGSSTHVPMNAEMGRVDQARLKQRYPYLKRRHFLMETLCPTFNCKFAGGISANAHRRHAAADRTRENDSPRHGLPHVRQNGLRYAHQTKQIDLENSFDLTDIEIFEKSDEDRYRRTERGHRYGRLPPASNRSPVEPGLPG